MAYLWIKTFHILCVTAWFAGLFYLPRIYVNLAMESHEVARARLLTMARKLLRFTTLLSVPAVLLGLWLWLGWPQGGGWIHAKLVLVVAIVGYHHMCASMLRKIAAGAPMRSHTWYRWFNEVPVLLLLGVLILVELKPF